MACDYQYYEYVLLYVNDTLEVSEDAERILRQKLGHYFELKEEPIGRLLCILVGEYERFNWRMVLSHGHSVCPSMSRPP